MKTKRAKRLTEWADKSKPSKYSVALDGSSIIVTRAGGDESVATFEGTYFNIKKVYGDAQQNYGLFNFDDILTGLARRLMRGWKPKTQFGFKGCDEWAMNQCKIAISAKVRDCWKLVLAKADPTVVSVHKAIFAATKKAANVTTTEEFFRRPHLVSDVMRYRAAAHAAVLAKDLFDIWRRNYTRTSEEFLRLRDSLRAKGLALKVESQVGFGEPSLEMIIDALSDWKALFSKTGRPYTSLNRTLMNLPGGIPCSFMQEMPTVEFKRPVTDRLELLAVLSTRRLNPHGSYPVHAIKSMDEILMHSVRGDIVRAMKRVSDHTRTPLSPRRARDVLSFVRFCVDCGQAHNGNIVGFAERSIDWHRFEQQKNIAAVRANLGGQPTREPPVLLPEYPGIQFLSTVDEICDEGERMGHCVASYARGAISGHYYLFHVEHAGEHATVEVGRDGVVAQAQGPRNTRNRACHWGKRVLSAWGKGLRLTAPVEVEAGPPPELQRGCPF